MISRRQLMKYGVAAAGAASLGAPSILRAQTTSLPFSLDIRAYGGNAFFFLGETAGIFSDLGMSPVLEGASGSAESVRRVATGTHPFGYADATTLIEFRQNNPGDAPKVILPLLDHGPQALLSIRHPLATLDDLRGRKLGIAANSAATKLFPALLGLNGMSESDLEIIAVDGRIRDTLLLQGELDAVVCFDYTTVFNLVENGVDRDSMNMVWFSDFGFDFPANSLIASHQMIEEQPDLCRAVALATARSFRATYADPVAATEAVCAFEPLLIPETEEARLRYIIETHIATPGVLENGLGVLTEERASAAIDLMAEGFEWETKPETASYFDPSFLPDASELRLA